MRVTLSALTFDLRGSLTFEVLPETDWGEARRRVSRVATLDGGAALNDGGYAVAERTIALQFPVQSRAAAAAVEWLLQTHAELCLSTEFGALRVAPESFRLQGRRGTLSLLVLEKLSA